MTTALDISQLPLMALLVLAFVGLTTWAANRW